MNLDKITDFFNHLGARPRRAALDQATVKRLLTLAGIGLLVAGCASTNVNSPQARANMGYLDFHTDPAAELSWSVARFDDRTQSFKSVFSELEPPPGGVLRLAFVPGRHRLQVTFMNRVIAKPAEIEVEVQDGRITPVLVTLTEAGTTQVERKDKTLANTAKGHYGRRTKISSDEAVKYGVSAVADSPVPYQPKERMPYAR